MSYSGCDDACSRNRRIIEAQIDLVTAELTTLEAQAAESAACALPVLATCFIQLAEQPQVHGVYLIMSMIKVNCMHG